MHPSAFITGDEFAAQYGKPGMTVIELGGLDVNGTLRPCFESRQMKYICVDLEPHPSVDVVIKPGDRLPFEDGSVDIAVTTSCFEHDPCFWLTFKEMCRIVKVGGHIYMNAPSTGSYHKNPGDNYRFYKDTSQALAYWASKEFNNMPAQPVSVSECFYIMDDKLIFNDFVCIWTRCTELTDKFILDDSIWNHDGILKTTIKQKYKNCYINVNTQSHIFQK